MPERRKSPQSFKTVFTPRRLFSTCDARSEVTRRHSFNDRLGANGPAEADLPKSEEKSPKNNCLYEVITGKLANLSTNSSPENLIKKTFNDRLSKVRNVTHENSGSDLNVTALNVTPENSDSDLNVSALNVTPENSDSNLNGFVISNKSEDLRTGEKGSLNQFLGKRIQGQTVAVSGHPLKSQEVIKVCEKDFAQTSEKMSKRDFLGNQKTESNLCRNGYNRRYTLDETVIKESEIEVEECNTATPTTQPKKADKKFSCQSDTYQPKRSESPQCSAEKISRLDFPTSFGSKGRRKSYYDSNVVEEVEKYFSKRFLLSTKNNWELPEPSKLFSTKPWEVKELIECKDKLNAIKEKLDDLELSRWHAHTKKRNKAGQVVWKLKKSINPEFPTQAWCKFYENLCTFDLIPEKAKSKKTLNTVHLCEAPGAFITSLNYYIKTNFDDDFEWNWLGTTLNPHYEGNPLTLMINEDRFILHTMDHWSFGEDQTGDLMNPPNVSDLINRAEKLGEVLLVTADGSIDCQDDPGEQENVVAWLHYCEAISALLVLGEGGNFLLKIFTVFEHMTICLLYLLSCVFEEVIVNKPATSKEGNSETYVVCKNYIGKTKLKPWLCGLLQNYGPNRLKKSLFPKESIPEEFLEAVIECAKTFRIYQTDIIEANLESYNNPCEKESSKNERIRRAVTYEFFKRYGLKELPNKYDIVGRHIINKMETYNVDPRREVGSFSDKIKRKEVSDRQKILDLKEDIQRLVLDIWPAEKIWWHKFDSESGLKLSDDIQICTGKPVKRINSSKFCLGRLLDIRNKVREIIVDSKVCDLPSFKRNTEELVKVPMQTRALDFKNKLWSSSDAGLNADEEYLAFNKIIEEFDKLSRDDSLVIYGYPLLTQFNVGLVYLLAHSFGRVGLTQPKGQDFAVIFDKHDISNNKFKVKQKLEEISENLNPLGKTVLAMLPIQKLCQGVFYKYVTLANNICVKEQVLDLIDIYLEATESKEEREKRR